MKKGECAMDQTSIRLTGKIRGTSLKNIHGLVDRVFDRGYADAKSYSFTQMSIRQPYGQGIQVTLTGDMSINHFLDGICPPAKT